MKTKPSKKSKLPKEDRKRLRAMDEDVPTCYSASTAESEMKLGHGFWGNPTSGYIYDKNNK